MAGDLWDDLTAAGGECDLRPCGYKAIDSLRLEKGFLNWGSDITPHDNPFEAGLGFAVKLDRGDFVGKDALLRMRDSGSPSRAMATLVVDSPEALLYGGEAVYADSECVGRLRSAGFGFTVAKTIALAYLPADLALPGTDRSRKFFARLTGGVNAPSRTPSVASDVSHYDHTASNAAM